ncbi:hypothetical protein [Spiroplasma endosymbiont of Othius punctulatus]|uniref:hypothetical protein n=1 Tax=Spiroplasma endosymbiont of Othius punctulatus TaxID=3066289 RepID=UPI0030D089A3
MKHLKKITIKIDSSIDDKDEIIVNSIESNFENIFTDMDHYFNQRYGQDTNTGSEGKKRYNKSVNKLSAKLLEEIIMPIFTKKCSEMLAETNVELQGTKEELQVTKVELQGTKEELQDTKMRLTELERVLKANGLI